MAIAFKSFDEALKALPTFIGGIDLVGQHKTVADLSFLVQHEIDLAVEGEDNDIQCKRQSDTTKRWQKCRAFLLRCKATLEVKREELIERRKKEYDAKACPNFVAGDGYCHHRNIHLAGEPICNHDHVAEHGENYPIVMITGCSECGSSYCD